MSAVPPEIPGVGSTAQKLRVSPGFDPLKAAVGPEEYFVLSRIDGAQSLRDVLLTTGLPVERAIAIVTRLRSIGALLLPGETSAPAPAGMPGQTRASQPRIPLPDRVSPMPAPPRTITRPQAPVPPRTITAAPPPHDLSLPNLTPAEQAALVEQVELVETDRRRLLAMARLADGRDPHALLGVPKDADAKTLKRAYFALSKDIHPDRYYGKRLGSFAERMSTVFEATSRAYARLTASPSSRGSQSPLAQGTRPDQPQTQEEYAAELFERACQLEVGGDALGAMKLFAAAVRVDPQPRYLRRAASCALAAGQPRTALEYAKKVQALAPSDPSAARLLASAFRQAGKLADAEEVLVMAMAMKSENDVLGAELTRDLAEVRRLLDGA